MSLRILRPRRVATTPPAPVYDVAGDCVSTLAVGQTRFLNVSSSLGDGINSTTFVFDGLSNPRVYQIDVAGDYIINFRLIAQVFCNTGTRPFRVITGKYSVSTIAASRYELASDGGYIAATLVAGGVEYPVSTWFLDGDINAAHAYYLYNIPPLELSKTGSPPAASVTPWVDDVRYLTLAAGDLVYMKIENGMKYSRVAFSDFISADAYNVMRVDEP